mmetsp:Transcript_11332/g.27793  ORF Transcript_11332/g.27793 Transcript_11332/m.27793 type:complete len:257 (-) Transcript_11332:309-1079(-)
MQSVSSMETCASVKCFPMLLREFLTVLNSLLSSMARSWLKHPSSREMLMPSGVHRLFWIAVSHSISPPARLITYLYSRNCPDGTWIPTVHTGNFFGSVASATPLCGSQNPSSLVFPVTTTVSPRCVSTLTRNSTAVTALPEGELCTVCWCTVWACVGRLLLKPNSRTICSRLDGRDSLFRLPELPEAAPLDAGGFPEAARALESERDCGLTLMGEAAPAAMELVVELSRGRCAPGSLPRESLLPMRESTSVRSLSS